MVSSNAAMALAILALTAGSAAASTVGFSFTSMERSISPGVSNSELFTLFDASDSFTEDTGGLFAPASSAASQTSLLDLSTSTLSFDGAAGATGGAVSSAAASSLLTLNFDIDSGANAQLLISGIFTAFDGGGIDPGSSGGNGSSFLRIFRNGSEVFSAGTAEGSATLASELVSLTQGSYELAISVNGSSIAQTNAGRGSADLDIVFIPAPGATAVALMGGVFATRRRR